MKIVPTRQLLLLGLVLLAMWYAAVSQGNSIAYLIAFVLVGMSLTSLLHTWGNLRRVTAGVQPAAPVFAGESARVPVHFRNAEQKPSYGLRGILPGKRRTWQPASARIDHLPAGDWEERELEAAVLRRGRHRIQRIEIETAFPLGILRLRKEVKVEGEMLVYPRPQGHQPLPRGESLGLTENEGNRPEGDNFSGVRPYRPGDSQRHVDWKAAARSNQLVTKLFTGGGDERVVLDWNTVHAGNTEDRLSQLARWILDAERENLEYGLNLPGLKEIAPSNGPIHQHKCLAALADFTGSF